MLTGPDIDTNAQLVRETGMAVLASGGVSSVEDIRQLAATGAEGVIVGRALYTGAVSLPEAIAAGAVPTIVPFRESLAGGEDLGFAQGEVDFELVIRPGLREH